jgi:hypothetical protein
MEAATGYRISVNIKIYGNVNVTGYVNVSIRLPQRSFKKQSAFCIIFNSINRKKQRKIPIQQERNFKLPAVWELDGPIINEPIISNTLILYAAKDCEFGRQHKFAD